MRRTNLLAALATGALVLASSGASAQGFRYGFGYGRGFGHRSGFARPYAFGPFYPGYPGYEFGYLDRPVTNLTYRNAFTGDVAYVERTVNAFRAAYEKRGDPFRTKADVQRLDETMERLRREADRYGGATLRGSELLRTALGYADAVGRRIRPSDGDLGSRWAEARRLLNRLAPTYRREAGR